MRATLFISLFSFFGFCGGQSLPTLGKVDVAQLCDDQVRCEARGDGVYNALKKGTPPYLAHKSGPEQYLGKVAPERNPRSVLKTCGGDVAANDILSSAPTPREIVPDKEGKTRIREAIKGQLVSAMAKKGIVDRADATLKASVDGAVSSLDFQKVSLVEQTHWLTDAGFEKRVGQCGDDFYEQVVYSITVIGLSDLFQKDLELKLGAALAAKLVKPIAPPSLAIETASTTEAAEALAAPAADAPPEAKPADAAAPAADAPPPITGKECEEVARLAITELGRESRFVASFGFDDR